ncbi:type II toxin-antitoxin system RelE/ParE family toxin [Parabacteroides sp.]
MRREIAWSDNAITLLDDIYEYYCLKSESAAIRLYNKILDSAEPLKTFPQAGPLEPMLKELPDNYRSLVVEKHYKLIYTISPDLIEIHAVWDCRQDD